MKIKGQVIIGAIGAFLAAAPAVAEEKTNSGAKDRDIAVERCLARAQSTAQFELCNWLRMVADGQPTEWLQWRQQQ